MSAEQLQNWLAPGVLGFYRSCEVTICGIVDRNHQAYNLFTLFSFEDSDTPANPEPHFLSHKNDHINDEFCLFVAQYKASLDYAISFYQEVQSGIKKANTPFGKLIIPEMTQVPPIFVPVDSTQTALMNRILKNNFCGGSMVLEWFGGKSTLRSLLNEKELQKATLRIREILPIDLFTVSDRIGNILFQLPEQIVFCKLSGTQNNTFCTIVFDKRIEHPEKYIVTTMTDTDHILIEAQVITNRCEHEWKLTLGETGGPYVITVMDTEHHIPVLRQTTSMMRTISNVLTFRGNLDSVRTITINGHTEKVTVNTSQLTTVGQPEYPWKSAAYQRQYEKRINELAISREFIRYGKGRNDRERGLRDLRSLMNATVNTQICLWDPYLSAKDLLETWYHTDTYGLELRAITSHKLLKREASSLETWMTEQRKQLSEGSNQYGINLQWRIQHDKFGFSFHDRFLILLPPNNETPRVWSLGTSLNSFGETHHILQLVSNPGYIADAFEELWSALEDSSCQIWNSNEVN